LPKFLKENDPEGFKKYDREIREWWTEVQENLDKLQDKVFTFRLTDLEGRVTETTTELDNLTQAAVREAAASIEEQKKAFLEEIVDIRAMLYSEPD
jgi:5'-deoxynucleotidase YfbR-like HD superfamily hydrolase